nr:MAG TPA: DNA packaging protein [Caudoviricetes sp.]
MRVDEPNPWLGAFFFIFLLPMPNLGGDNVGRETAEFEKITVPSKTLEALFGLKDRTIRDLADKGIVQRDSHGRYLLWNSAKGYITFLKVANASKNSQNDVEDDTELNLDEEKAQHEHLKRQITEIKLQLIKGQVHKAEDVEAVMTDMFARFKSKMTALPSKLARKLEGKSRIDIQKILKTEIDNALVELASYNAADFYSDEHIEISGEALSSLGDDEDNE